MSCSWQSPPTVCQAWYSETLFTVRGTIKYIVAFLNVIRATHFFKVFLLVLITHQLANKPKKTDMKIHAFWLLRLILIYHSTYFFLPSSTTTKVSTVNMVQLSRVCDCTMIGAFTNHRRIAQLIAGVHILLNCLCLTVD